MTVIVSSLVCNWWWL